MEPKTLRASKTWNHRWWVGLFDLQPGLFFSLGVELAEDREEPLVFASAFIEGTEGLPLPVPQELAGPEGSYTILAGALCPVPGRPEEVLSGEVFVMDREGEKHALGPVSFAPPPSASFVGVQFCPLCRASVTLEDFFYTLNAGYVHRSCIWPGKK